MRTIKFRAWDKLNEVIGDVLQYLPYAGENGTIKIDINAGVAYMSHDFEIMQFTGLLDKNGKEIYEGDIVKYSIDGGYGEGRIEIVREVGFENGHFYPFLHGREEFHQKAYPEYCEIIGNIYENPELLNQCA